MIAMLSGQNRLPVGTGTVALARGRLGGGVLTEQNFHNTRAQLERLVLGTPPSVRVRVGRVRCTSSSAAPASPPGPAAALDHFHSSKSVHVKK
jgi:hypothetical protein